jgi:hypothetical protein
MTRHATYSSFNLTPQHFHTCGNCGASTVSSAVKPITDFFERVEPGGMVPSGECPVCGALCYPNKSLKKQRKKRKVKRGT